MNFLRSFMPFNRVFVVALLLFSTASGQQLSHPLSAAGAGPRRAPSAPDTVRVLAVMVQFQKDSDPATDGDGQFVLTPPATPVLDAPPSDSAYFAGHLAFLASYFQKVSKDRTVVRWTLLGAVYTLPGVMYDYSPRPGEPNDRLANLARDTWRAVDSSGGAGDFSRYDCFVLFHAGVGHDVDLVSSLGYDPSPHDIPSIYLGPNAFTAAGLGGGVAVNHGAFRITNTIIMPETESRVIPSVTGNAPLTLGINGLLCASLGSYLGLPDLFNTRSGASGIGRFGLMDGQSIFSFSGAFPPEPSAWEKYWLGWVNPITIPAGTTTLSIPAVALADTIYRVPISSGEYFLLENRNRNPRRTGQTVTTLSGGAVRQQHFARDTAGFAFDDISSITGTVIDVDQPDWSLPGLVDQDGTFYDGGMLIWHIDETVINATIATNAVNADSSHRGVNLEEADGSQDIGHTYDLLSPGSGSEAGTPLDFWFQGNPAPVNRNEFSATTFPSSNSNMGALSHVKIDQFSSRGPRMSARVTRGDAVAPVGGYPRQLGEILKWSATVVEAGPSTGLLVGTTGLPLPRFTTLGEVDPPTVGGKLYMLPLDSSGHIAPFRASGVVALPGTPGASFQSSAAAADLNGDGIQDIVVTELIQTPNPGGFIRAFSLAGATTDSLALPIFSRPFTPGLFVAPVIADSLIAVAGARGTVLLFRFDGTPVDSISPPQSPGITVGGISRWKLPDSFLITYSDGTVLLTVRSPGGALVRPDVAVTYGPGGLAGPAATGLFGPDASRGRILTAFVSPPDLLYLVDSALVPVAGFPVTLPGMARPVLADIDGDGMRDIVLCAGGKVYAYNVSGTLLDNFPVTIPGVTGLVGSVVGDVDGDGSPDIVSVSYDGVAYAFNRFGKLVPGFPLTVGAGLDPSVALIARNGRITLAVAASDGSVSAWVTGHTSGTPDARLYPWPEDGRDSRHSGLDLTPLTPGSPAAEFFPPGRAYNWPNPVYNGMTYFRFFVRDNASVTIRIFDMAGDHVATLNGQGSGGVDNEIAWDVSHIQSGIYFARIEATTGGSSGMKIVKVAVVK